MYSPLGFKVFLKNVIKWVPFQSNFESKKLNVSMLFYAKIIIIT